MQLTLLHIEKILQIFIEDIYSDIIQQLKYAHLLPWIAEMNPILTIKISF